MKRMLSLTAMAILLAGCDADVNVCEETKALVITDASESFSIEVDLADSELPGWSAGSYFIQAWDCADLSWWSTVPASKVVQVTQYAEEFCTQDEVTTEYYPCNSPLGSDAMFRDMDGDGISQYEHDCDDTDPTTGGDTNGDGASDCVDQDGDGVSLEAGDCAEGDPQIIGYDTDHDGTSDCIDNDEDGLTEQEGDCDDENPLVSNGDVDADGSPDCSDDDGDGFSEVEGDCGDDDPQVYPGADEMCGGKDENCDGEVDSIVDADQDGVLPCAEEADCDDQDNAVYPGSVEVCDSKDNNCDGTVDEGFDQDGDGISSCASLPDCDDLNGNIYPGATERCDGSVDLNCDGVSGSVVDADGDGVPGCVVDEKAADCDDQNTDKYPGAVEVCNGLDEDCLEGSDNGLEMPDSDEPNDSTVAATDMGSLEVGEQSWAATLSSNGDEDWYLVEVPGVSWTELHIRLDQIPAWANYNLYLYRVGESTTTLVDSATADGSTAEEVLAERISDKLEPSEWLIVVTASQGSSACAPYRVTATLN